MKNLFKKATIWLLKTFAPAKCIEKYMLKSNPEAKKYRLSKEKELKYLFKLLDKGSLTAEFVNNRVWSSWVVKEVIREGVKGIIPSNDEEFDYIFDNDDEDDIMNAIKHYTPRKRSMARFISYSTPELALKIARTYPHHFDGVSEEVNYGIGRINLEVIDYLYTQGIWPASEYLHYLRCVKCDKGIMSNELWKKYESIFMASFEDKNFIEKFATFYHYHDDLPKQLQNISKCMEAPDAAFLMSHKPKLFKIFIEKYLATAPQEYKIAEFYNYVLAYASSNQIVYNICKEFTATIIAMKIANNEAVETLLCKALKTFLDRGENALADKIAEALCPQDGRTYKNKDNNVFIYWK